MTFIVKVSEQQTKQAGISSQEPRMSFISPLIMIEDYYEDQDYVNQKNQMR